MLTADIELLEVFLRPHHLTGVHRGAGERGMTAFIGGFHRRWEPLPWPATWVGAAVPLAAARRGRAKGKRSAAALAN